MNEDKLAENNKVLKTEMAVRLDLLEASLAHEKEMNVRLQGQVKHMTEQLKAISNQFFKVSLVTPVEVEYFIQSLKTLLTDKNLKTKLEEMLAMEGFLGSIAQALRMYGVKLVEQKGDIKK